MKAEDYVLKENPDITEAVDQSWLLKIAGSFPAFYERNFRLYFTGQLVSACGTWLQSVALGWIVFELTGSPFWVGTVAALGVLPTILFGLIGGVIVDRFDKKKVLYVTQGAAMILAFTLGILTLLGKINLIEICLLSFMFGTVNAIDLPALQAFISEMVPRDKLASAIALNSALTNSARAIGPALAGILINLIGTGWTFIFNGISFIAVLMAFAAMVIRNQTGHHKDIHPLRMIQQGLVYTFKDRSLALFMFAASGVAIFGYSYTAILPVIAVHVFKGGSDTLGFLLSATGLGALLGAIAISGFSKSMSAKTFVVGGNVILGLALLLFSHTTNLYIGLASLFVVGFAFTFEFSMINTLIQHVVKSEMRGRVMSILILMFQGAAFIGNFAVGYFAEHIGSGHAVEAGAIGVLLVAGCLYIFKEDISELEEVR